MNPAVDAFLAPHRSRDTPFLILPDGARVTHAAFLDLAARMVAVLRGLGLQPGDRIAAQVAKSPEALALYAACLQGGFVFLPLNTGYTGAELDYFVTDSGAALLVCDPADEGRLSAPALLTLGARGDGTLMARAAEAVPDTTVTPRAGSDLAALLYTSGTTGRSKGAMLSQDNLISNARALADLWRFDAHDRLLHALPIFHTHGLFVATNVTLLAGGAMIFLPRFDADEMLRLMPQATTMMGVPTFYTRLLAEPGFTRDLAGHMRLFISGSAPLLAETHAAFEARTGHRILERYGMTETNMSTSNPYEGERRPGTVGLPLPGVELRIMAEGREVPPGEIGMIEVRGPNVFQGYWNMPEKTAEELRPDGWFLTGDLASRDADGYVTIVGRGKDLIISGGLNVYPKEVEEVLDSLPGVLESAVIGLPHADLGEAVAAVIARRPGEEPDVDALLAAAGERLARFKLPRRAVIVDELPRNTMGKVQKAELRRTYAEMFR